jgi:hypothetical protein
VWAALRQIDADLSAAAPGVAEQIIAAEDLVEARVFPFQAMSWAAGVIGGISLVLTISGIYERRTARPVSFPGRARTP